LKYLAERKNIKTLILSNYSDRIAELNAITEPNKQAYADLHGYVFENRKIDYERDQVGWLNYVLDQLNFYNRVMTVGCDVLFCNTSIRIADRMPYNEQRVVIARDQLTNWPINNDVMLWPAGDLARELLGQLIKDYDKWKNFTQLWQIHLFNLISSGAFKNHVRIVDAKEMNATYQPVVNFIDNGKVMEIRHPGPSSFQFGDWILHAVDMPLDYKIRVMKWGMQFVTKDGTWKPVMPGRQ
jgi:hypothetical protein